MYLIEKLEDKEAVKRAAEQPPFGPGFSPEILGRIQRLEVWGSSFSDSGADCCVYKAFDNAGCAVGEIRLGGY